MTPPLFSVVVPCYGHARYLVQAIESVWSQTFDNFEIVAVDDGSPDNSGELLDEMAASSPRPMRVLHTPNAGAHRALNTGAAAARAPYLAFLNDDDLYLPDRLDVFARVIYKAPTFFWGFTGVDAIGADGAILPLSSVPDDGRREAILRSERPQEAVAALPRLNTAVSSGNLVIEKATFASVGGFRELRFNHDWDLVLRLLTQGQPFSVERKLYLYRVHTDNFFNRVTSDVGMREAREESDRILGDYAANRARLLRAGIHDAPAGTASPDAEMAIKAALWTVDRLHGVRPVYAVVRAAARALRSMRRRWIER